MTEKLCESRSPELGRQLFVKLYGPSVHLHVHKSRAMQAVSINQLRSNIKKYLDDVSKSSDIIVVSRASEDEAMKR